MVLETQRLILRPWSGEDAQFYIDTPKTLV